MIRIQCLLILLIAATVQAGSLPIGDDTTPQMTPILRIPNIGNADLVPTAEEPFTSRIVHGLDGDSSRLDTFDMLASRILVEEYEPCRDKAGGTVFCWVQNREKIPTDPDFTDVSVITSAEFRRDGTTGSFVRGTIFLPIEGRAWRFQSVGTYDGQEVRSEYGYAVPEPSGLIILVGLLVHLPLRRCRRR